METYGESKDREHDRMSNANTRVIIGVILVLAGLFLVLRNTGLFPDYLENIIFSWPMLLVTIGLVMTVGSKERTAGIIVMGVGGFFLSREYSVKHFIFTTYSGRQSL